jgi:hypothetical protein
MAKKGIITALAGIVGFVAVSALVATFILRQTQRQELGFFIDNPEEEALTNIFAKPGGEVVFQVDDVDFYQFTGVAGPDGWWRIKNSRLYSFGEEVEIPSREAWIHQSVLALGTDNSDGHYRSLRAEPRPDAPKAGTIREFHAVVRPLELSSDGKWVKVCYEPDNLTGWAEASLMLDEAFEPGDGLDFPTLYVYAVPDGDTELLSGPGNGERTLVLEKGKEYGMLVAKAKDGWWEVKDDYVSSGDEDIDLPEPSWIPASAVCLYASEDTVPVYGKADEGSAAVGTLKAGMVVHPLEVKGEWPRWARIVAVDDPGLTGWVDSMSLSFSLED